MKKVLSFLTPIALADLSSQLSDDLLNFGQFTDEDIAEVLLEMNGDQTESEFGEVDLEQ